MSEMGGKRTFDCRVRFTLLILLQGMAEPTLICRVGRSTPMSEFTARANIKNFKEQLLTSSDEVQKATLRKLLTEEVALLAELVADQH